MTVWAGTRTLVLHSLRGAPGDVPGHPDRPLAHWQVVARALDADVASYATAAARRGPWFAAAFGGRQPLGSALSAALDAGRYDRIYALDEDVGLPCALLLAARRWRGAMTCLVHHVSPRRRAVVKALGGRIIRRWFTFAEAQRDALVAAGVSPSRVVDHPIPADTGFWRPGPSRDALPLIVAVGAADRDYPTLFAAVDGLPCRVEVFGHGYAGADAARLAGARAPANVVLMPHLSVAALRDRLGAASMAVLPLRPVAYAAGATALVEAMAAGLPVAATRIEGLRSYLAAASPGPQCPPADAAAMRAAVQGLLADPSASAALGARNRQWVLDNAGVEHFGDIVSRTVLAA